jgi:hypothetical protein
MSGPADLQNPEAIALWLQGSLLDPWGSAIRRALLRGRQIERRLVEQGFNHCGGDQCGQPFATILREMTRVDEQLFAAGQLSIGVDAENPRFGCHFPDLLVVNLNQSGRGVRRA